MKTSRTVVSILRAENVPEAVRKAVELAGGVEIRKDDTVVIKPNAKNQAPPGYGIVTDVAVIEPLVEMSLEKGARRVKIADGAAYPSGSYHTLSAFEAMGVTKIAKKWDLDLVDLNSYDSVDLDVPGSLVLDRVRVGRAVTEADVLINVPVSRLTGRLCCPTASRTSASASPAERRRSASTAWASTRGCWMSTRSSGPTSTS